MIFRNSKVKLIEQLRKIGFCKQNLTVYISLYIVAKKKEIKCR